MLMYPQPNYSRVVYRRQFFPQELLADELTHVLYAFANINLVIGEV
jgi:GH18 family chitinase